MHTASTPAITKGLGVTTRIPVRYLRLSKDSIAKNPSPIELWATVAQPCPTIGPPLPKYWATVARLLGNRCLTWPKQWATIAEALDNLAQPCPTIWQPLPKYWATVARLLGNRCPSIGQPLPDYWANLGNGCPMLGQGWARLPNANAWDAASPKLNVSACDSVVVTNATDAIPRDCDL